jgi:hypothetical protein
VFFTCLDRSLIAEAALRSRSAGRDENNSRSAKFCNTRRLRGEIVSRQCSLEARDGTIGSPRWDESRCRGMIRCRLLPRSCPPPDWITHMTRHRRFRCRLPGRIRRRSASHRLVRVTCAGVGMHLDALRRIIVDRRPLKPWLRAQHSRCSSRNRRAGPPHSRQEFLPSGGTGRTIILSPAARDELASGCSVTAAAYEEVPGRASAPPAVRGVIRELPL